MTGVKKYIKTLIAVIATLFFSGCEGTTAVGVGVYGGYGYPYYGYGGGYYGGGYYRPPVDRPDRPDRPNRPEHPIERPDRPSTLPAHTRPSRPSVSMQTMGRPSGGMRMRRR